MMTGMSSPLARSSRQTSQPLMPGIMMSRRRRSGASDSARASPRRPSVAESVWYPSKRRLSSSPRTISGSSSTIRMRGIYRPPLRAVLGHGQEEREPAPLARTALDAHAPPVGLGDVLDQSQPHPAAPGALSLTTSDAVELLEDSLRLSGRYAYALVGHLDHHPLALSPGADPEPPALRRVLEGIVHEVGEGLLDRVRINERIGQVGRHRHLQLEASLGEGVTEGVEDLVDQRLDRMRTELVALPPSLDAREVQDVVDEPRETLALTGDDGVVLAPRRLVGSAAELERFAEHPDQGQRRLEVVGDIRDEVRLEARHLRLALDDTVGGTEPEGDDDEEEAECGHEEHRLPPDVAAGRGALRLIQRDAPGWHRLAKGDGEHAMGPIERSRRIDGLALGVEHGQHARPFQPAERLWEDVPLHGLPAAPEDSKHGTSGGAGNHRGQHDLVAYEEVAPPSAVPDAQRDLAKQRGLPTARGVQHPPLAIDEGEAVEDGVPPAPLVQRVGSRRRVHEQHLKAREGFLLALEDGHLGLLRRHGEHVPRLLAEKQLGRGLPLAQRYVAEHREDPGGDEDGAEREDAGPAHFSASSFLIMASVSS